jgi:hypothetical protein
MNKLLVALVASAFGSVAAMADDKTLAHPDDKAKRPQRAARAVEYIERVPLSTLDIDQAKAARALAKERWAKMSPTQQMVTQEAAARKEQDRLTALDEVANQSIGWPRDGDFWTKRDRHMLTPVPRERPVQREPAKANP